MPRVFLDEDLAPASDERRIDLRKADPGVVIRHPFESLAHDLVESGAPSRRDAWAHLLYRIRIVNIRRRDQRHARWFVRNPCA